jgi:hypothetical protein
MISSPVAGSVSFPVFPSRTLGGQRKKMTVTAGILCGKGNEILLSSDKKISWGASTTNTGGSKIYDLPLNLWGAVADDVSWTHIFISKLCDELRSVSDDAKALDSVKLAMQRSGIYMFKWMRGEILEKEVGITEDEFLHDSKLSPRLRRKADRVLKIENLPIEVIIAGYTSVHCVFFYTDGRQIVEQSSPGIFTGGSGGPLAQNWLNFRKQNVHFSCQRSFIHLQEALIFAGLDPFVGADYGVFLLRRGKTAEQMNLQGTGRENWARDAASRVSLRKTDGFDDPAEDSKFRAAFGI